MINCPLCEAVTSTFGRSTARYSNTFIYNQGRCPQSHALKALQVFDLESLTANGIFRRIKKRKETGWAS